MLRKTLVVLSLTILASTALAGIEPPYEPPPDPNPCPHPGCDNDGTRITEVSVGFGRLTRESTDSCFPVTHWCDELYIDAEAEARAEALETCTGTAVCPNDEEVATAVAAAQAWATLACRSSAEANAGLEGYIEAEATLQVARHGNSGAVHRIKFDGGLGTAVKAVARTEASSDVEFCSGSTGECPETCSTTSPYCPELQAYAWTSNQSLAEMCNEADFRDDDFINFCLKAEATSQAGTQAVARAQGSAGSRALAEAGYEAGGALENQVWAANIERYESSFGGIACGFVLAGAGAHSAAYVDAYVDVFMAGWTDACVEVCPGTTIDCPAEPPPEWSICAATEAEAEAHAVGYAESFAAAHAAALAYTCVYGAAIAEFSNENGNADNDILRVRRVGPGGRFANAWMGTWCDVPEGEDESPPPEGDGDYETCAGTVCIGPN